MKDPRYLNTDLELDSKEDLTAIAESFGEDVVVMYCGEWGKNNRAAFEVSGSSIADVNGAIGLFCALIEGLPYDLRGLWDRSFSKTFSVGFESGDSNSSLEVRLEPYIVERVAVIGASLTVTLYPVDKNGT